ncbi:MAG: 4Fe-4S dicluster domain-containing protein [Lachnospiraceae bacterium]|nr:4Fe-4S dicluster domain-containing protein [Lachnospiraceae bacterium]
MTIDELKKILRESGVVGAGGAGFPTYAKLDERANTILLNCAECEPLLTLHRQLLKLRAEEILKAFEEVRKTVKATEGIIGIKSEYTATINELNKYIDDYPAIRIKELPGAYPMGDEVVLIYEATGKVVRPGGLPIEQGVAVFNVETMYNVSKAMNAKLGVTEKLVTIVGEVTDPKTVRLPIGTSIDEAVSFAGDVKIEEPVYFVGVPMMGRIMKGSDPITKTTNAILVLPKDHTLVLKKQADTSIQLNRAASICCQCQMCTDLCPRHALGHPIEPHLFMRAASNRDFQDMNPFLNTFYCSSCGLCELFSCPQGLQPRTLITEYKNGLRAKGVKPPAEPKVHDVIRQRDDRKAPEKRLAARLGVTQYECEALLEEDTKSVRQVKINLSQHIGAPSKLNVKVGDVLKKGDIVGLAADGLGVNIHASVDGKVVEATDKYVKIKA